MSAINTIHLDGLPISDISKDELAPALVNSFRSNNRAVAAFALHVSALSLRRRGDYRSALEAADFVYPDGISVALLGRAYGGQLLQRCPTTDLGHAVLRLLTVDLRRRVRVALIGGPVGLAEDAARVLAEQHNCSVVMTDHGYHDEWTSLFRKLHEFRPDVVFVGLGVPKEHLWVAEHLSELPPSLVMTCGGWFGFLSGRERRAPVWMREVGLEWLFRFLQSPGRLWKRYAAGAIAAGGLLVRSRGTKTKRSR